MPRRAIFAPTNRLREIREKKGLSLREVVEGLGYGTPTWLSRLEIGGRDLKLEDAKALARFFEIPVADLFLLADGGLKEDEREVIETLRGLPEELRAAAFAMVESQRPWRRSLEPGNAAQQQQAK